MVDYGTQTSGNASTGRSGGERTDDMANKKTSIGGQALLEGIMMRGPKMSAMAVRNPQGEIVLEEWPTAGVKRAKVLQLPFVRGIFNLVDSLRMGYKCLMRSAEIAGLDEDEAKKEPKWYDKLFDAILMPLSVVLAVVICFGLFLYAPAQLYNWLCIPFPALKDMYMLRSAFEGVLRIILFVGYVAATSLSKDIRRTYMYHGAEHKTIFCYEAGLPLTVENVRKQSRFHPRCGTSFMILVLIVGIVISFFIHIQNPLLRAMVKLPLLPVIAGIGYELIKLAGRKDNLLTRIISAPGMWLQHITVKEPEDSMIECAIRAMEIAIPGDDSDQY